MAGDSRRSKTEQQAKDIETKLVSLLAEVEQLSTQPRLGNKWLGIRIAVAEVRWSVRLMMNPYDRKETM